MASALDNLYFTAGSNDLFLCGLAEATSLDGELLRKFAVTEDADTVADVLDDTLFDKGYRIDHCAVVKAIQFLDIYNGVMSAEFIVETAFRQTQV